ncbi:MAG: thiamine pyrophosphate-dependent enzyme [Cyanobacteriota bacterium]|nr:thiamine pyrophosphate-dependent enzyme [Cyanobacteriota bacterium]
MSVSVADRLAHRLAARGLRRCFGYLGHHIEPLPQALLRSGHEVLIAASETGAGYMAQGWFLASGRPALVFCGGGPGLALLVPALQTARLEGFPLLLILGQTGSNGLPRFQDTGSDGSRDRELLAALQLPSFHLELVAGLEAALAFAERQLRQRASAVLTVPCDVLAAAAPEPPPAPAAPAPWPAWDAAPEASGHSSDGASGCGPAKANGPLGQIAAGIAAEPAMAGSYRCVVKALLQHLPGDTLWFGDAGQSRHAMRMAFQPLGIPLQDCPRSAPMGWAIAAAIGAACHDPQRPVCCFGGDGSARMMAGEWATAVRHQLPITFVLALNGVLGSPYGRLRESGAEALSQLPVIDWCALAAAMGLPARRVADGCAIAEALAILAPQGGPRLLVVPLPARDPDVVPPYSLKGEP